MDLFFFHFNLFLIKFCNVLNKSLETCKNPVQDVDRIVYIVFIEKKASGCLQPGVSYQSAKISGRTGSQPGLSHHSQKIKHIDSIHFGSMAVDVVGINTYTTHHTCVECVIHPLCDLLSVPIKSPTRGFLLFLFCFLDKQKQQRHTQIKWVFCIQVNLQLNLGDTMFLFLSFFWFFLLLSNILMVSNMYYRRVGFLFFLCPSP